MKGHKSSFSVLFSRENHVSNPDPYCTVATGMIQWKWGLGCPRLFTLSFSPGQFPLDYIDQLKAQFISKSYHVIICTSIRGKHNRLAAGEVNMVVEGKT
jgi:hypothetical protein